MIFSAEQLAIMGAAAERERERKRAELERAELERERSSGTPAPLPAQLDLDGGAHEIARPTERLRLFEPAPAQLEGQAFLTDAELEL